MGFSQISPDMNDTYIYIVHIYIYIYIYVILLLGNQYPGYAESLPIALPLIIITYITLYRAVFRMWEAPTTKLTFLQKNISNGERNTEEKNSNILGRAGEGC